MVFNLLNQLFHNKLKSDKIHKENYDKMVAGKEAEKEKIREVADKEIQQLNNRLGKTNQQIQNLTEQRVK